MQLNRRDAIKNTSINFEEFIVKKTKRLYCQNQGLTIPSTHLACDSSQKGLFSLLPQTQICRLHVPLETLPVGKSNL